jgi:hypothetical protein
MAFGVALLGLLPECTRTPAGKCTLEKSLLARPIRQTLVFRNAWLREQYVIKVSIPCYNFQSLC